jgi:hypothetical protein
MSRVPDEIMELILRSLGVPDLGTVAQTSRVWRAVLMSNRPWAAYFRSLDPEDSMVWLPHPQPPLCPLKIRTYLTYAWTDRSALACYHEPIRILMGDMHTRLVKNVDMIKRETWTHWRTIQYATECESDDNKCSREWVCLVTRLHGKVRTALDQARLVAMLTGQVGLHLRWLTMTGRHIQVATRRTPSSEGQETVKLTITRLSRRFAFLADNLKQVLRVFRW